MTSLGWNLWITAASQQLLLTDLDKHWYCAEKRQGFHIAVEIPGVIFCVLNSRKNKKKKREKKLPPYLYIVLFVFYCPTGIPFPIIVAWAIGKLYYDNEK